MENVPSRNGETSAMQVRHALSSADAFAYLAGNDHRPLLILRECLKCNGTDDALMTRNQDNERTLVMSRWFHCVKLPPDVLDEDHPFHALFDGEKPQHLFLSRWDGTQRKDLNGQQSRTELWALMESYLAAEYAERFDTSLKTLLTLLDRFDRMDSDILALKSEMDDVVEKGQAATKLKKLQAKVAGLEADKARARTEVLALSELKLKEPTPAKPDSTPAAPGAARG